MILRQALALPSRAVKRTAADTPRVCVRFPPKPLLHHGGNALAYSVGQLSSLAEHPYRRVPN
jgi:hypothetical protein